MASCVFIDLSGTLHVGRQPLPGAIEAVDRLRRKGYRVRFVSNTSSKSRRQLQAALMEIGFDISMEELFTAPLVVHRYLQQQKLRPFLLVHQDLIEEFTDLPQDNPNAVVVGCALNHFTYDNLNRAFLLLKEGAPLIATGRTACFQGPNGLLLDSGPFVAALEFAADTEALVLGKPSPGFFAAARDEFLCPASRVTMIGDDAASDVGGALAAGMRGILVQTGKYRPGDEEKIGRPGAWVVPDMMVAVDRIFELEETGT
ncbi:MAG: TIGR01458 family HAD-type hydrolase [Syntrophotaleaceae bacterium]